DAAQVAQRAIGHPADGAKVVLEGIEIFGVIAALPERRLGPDPLADETWPHVGQRLVHAPADMSAEIHEQRERLHRKTLLLEERLEQRELKRWKPCRKRRHADVGDRLIGRHQWAPPGYAVSRRAALSLA